MLVWTGTLTIYHKMIGILLAILIPILALFGYTSQRSIQVVEQELKTSNLHQLSQLLNQFNATVDQLAVFSGMLIKDSTIQELFMVSDGMLPPYNSYKLKNTIYEKLTLQTAASSWLNDLTVFFPKTGEVVSTAPKTSFDDLRLADAVDTNWHYVPGSSADITRGWFERYTVVPWHSFGEVAKADVIIRASFSNRNIVRLLNGYKSGHQTNPFFFSPGLPPITGSESSSELVRAVAGWVERELPAEQGNRIVAIDGKKYLITYVSAGSIGWYLVDYVPLAQIVSPITQSRNLFYVTLGLLLAFGAFSLQFLYRHVLVPIRILIRHVQRLKLGDFATRIRHKSNREFRFLFDRFNEMAEEIQELIDKVYKEQLHARDAILKQLQAQINPHFLYNSLAFIQSMTQLDDKKAVIAMVHHLGDYYRYTTRIEKQSVTLVEELQLVDNYLSICALQLSRLHYDIRFPPDMSGIGVSRLLLQPLAENAVLHGIEPKPGPGLIDISCAMDGSFVSVVVEDNGCGLDEDALEALRLKLASPPGEATGCGLWNVRQRLILRYGDRAGLLLGPSALGGLRVELRWPAEIPIEAGGGDSLAIADR